MYDFSDLVVFEMANNHQGSVAHGMRIVEEMSKIARRYDIRAAVKLQYRDLETFIHPDFRDRSDVKHIPRFLETKLDWAELQALTMAISDQGLVAVVTPFDEKSVDMALNHGVEVLKVASCSCNDWPLLEKVAATGRPVICSTGGAKLAEIDKLVTFMEHRGVDDLALLHCVGIYPTEDRDQQLQYLRRLMMRYPHCAVGYSGHEAPENTKVSTAAIAIGAQILERHVGIPTETTPLNAYSMNPDQVEAWIQAVLEARVMCGSGGADKRVTESEQISLRSLARGVFARTTIECGEALTPEKVFFAMPCAPGQTTTGEYLDSMVASQDYAPNEAIAETRRYDPIRLMRSVLHEAKGLLREARIPTGSEFELELSHHYGMDSFRRCGAIIVSFVNREYCKKLIVMLPGQMHPSHAHAKKEETFQVLYGDMELTIDGEHRFMKPGEMQLVRRGQYHSFSTKTGLVFEEISTTHSKGDSYYEDSNISRLDPAARKTVVDSW